MMLLLLLIASVSAAEFSFNDHHCERFCADSGMSKSSGCVRKCSAFHKRSIFKADPDMCSEEGSTTQYIVQKGETIWSIAEKVTGNPAAWREICAQNGGLSYSIHGGYNLAHCANLKRGDVLCIPQKAAYSSSRCEACTEYHCGLELTTCNSRSLCHYSCMKGNARQSALRSFQQAARHNTERALFAESVHKAMVEEARHARLQKEIEENVDGKWDYLQ
jgi:hypothetical protein